MNTAYSENPIKVKTVYPPKCTLLKEKNGLLCPRIIEIEVEIYGNLNKHLVRCTLFSEEEEILALEQDAEVAEEKKALRDAVRKLSEANTFIKEQNQKLTSTLNKSASYMTRLKDVVVTLEEKLDKASVDNAKLLYQNKAFTSDSLNERQKQKLAEAVSNAETIEEAKVIFETLQNTVGSTSRKTQPNSLSEAVQKTSSVILSSRKNDSSRESKLNPTLNRWKFLAGIDK